MKKIICCSQRVGFRPATVDIITHCFDFYTSKRSRKHEISVFFWWTPLLRAEKARKGKKKTPVTRGRKKIKKQEGKTMKKTVCCPCLRQRYQYAPFFRRSCTVGETTFRHLPTSFDLSRYITTDCDRFRQRTVTQRFRFRRKRKARVENDPCR